MIVIVFSIAQNCIQDPVKRLRWSVCIQDPVKRLRWSVLRKQLTAKSR